MSIKGKIINLAKQYPQEAQKVMKLWDSVKPDVKCPDGMTPSLIVGFDGEVRLACCSPGSTVCAPTVKGNG